MTTPYDNLEGKFLSMWTWFKFRWEQLSWFFAVLQCVMYNAAINDAVGANLVLVI